MRGLVSLTLTGPYTIIHIHVIITLHFLFILRAPKSILVVGVGA